MLLAVAVVVALGWYGVDRGLDSLRERFADPEDYPGPGTGQVYVTVEDGQTVGGIAGTLVEEDVVASREAFVTAASAQNGSIRPGVYAMRLQMAAADAVTLLVGGSTRATSTFTILPGKTVAELLPLLSETTDIPVRQFRRVLADPDALGLPAGAEGNAEGYLFPGQYPLLPDATARSVLVPMVEAWRSHAEEIDLEGAADRLGYSVHELMTIASMVQAEGATLSARDKGRIARVIYNRLEIEPNPSAGFLGIDATVNYALGKPPRARLTFAEIDSVADSPYNTYRQQGLPPGPIEAPGAAAIDATVAPVDGPWFYYVTVNLRTRLTKFAVTDAEFQQLRAELDQYCATQSERC